MYYKIVSDGQIVDVCDGMSFVRFQKRNGIFLTSDEAEATGVVTSDGSTIYTLEGAVRVDGYEVATYAEIPEEDYADLRQQLVENGVLKDATAETQDTQAEGTEEQEHEPAAKSKELLLIEKQQKQIDFLTECILEMSEAVYG